MAYRFAPALRMCGGSALLSPTRPPVACLLCGEERGPVLEEGEGAGVLVGGDNEEKFLPVSGDVKANHALAIDTQRGTEGEEDGGVTDLNAVTILVDVHDGHFITHGDEVKLLAVAGPPGPLPATGRDLPHAVATGCWKDKNLRAGMEHHGDGDESAGGRELTTGARACGVGRSKKAARLFTGVEGNHVEIAVGTFGEEVAAIGRPVRHGEIVMDLLDVDGVTGTARGANDDARDTVG